MKSFYQGSIRRKRERRKEGKYRKKQNLQVKGPEKRRKRSQENPERGANQEGNRL